MPKHRYNKGKQEYKVYSNVEKSLVKLSIDNIDDLLYEYCYQVFTSISGKSIPFIRPYVQNKLLEKEH